MEQVFFAEKVALRSSVCGSPKRSTHIFSFKTRPCCQQHAPQELREFTSSCRDTHVCTGSHDLLEIKHPRHTCVHASSRQTARHTRTHFTQYCMHMSKHTHPTFVKHPPCAERWAGHERSREKQGSEGASLGLPRAHTAGRAGGRSSGRWAWGLSPCLSLGMSKVRVCGVVERFSPPPPPSQCGQASSGQA